MKIKRLAQSPIPKGNVNILRFPKLGEAVNQETPPTPRPVLFLSWVREIDSYGDTHGETHWLMGWLVIKR